ncbi:MAG: type IV pilus assembly protein PilM [Phycisphaeraceae bacterium]|nr:MAG: type IV pilus assembly protein PilM [Phycisphaeraceae bacterium]
MPSSNVCWGVEIGSGAIKALKLELDGDQPRVRDYAVLNHSKVLSTPELDTGEAVRVALGTLTSQFDLSGAMLAISVPGHQSFARFAKLPPVEPKKVPDIVKFEAVQQIPFPLEEVEWDYQTFVSPDSPDIEVGIFAVTRPRIMELLGQVGDVGLTPEIATLSPVAAYNALAYDLEFTEKTPGTIILDIGTTATDLIIAEAGRVWVRTFPLGGHQFTDALVTSFKLSYSKAERLKREAEQTKHARHVFQAMRPVFTDLVQEVQRSIGYYQSVHAGADLKRLIGLGNTFRLPGLRKYLKQQLHMDIYRIEGFKRLKGPDGREADFTDASLNLGTAYGLALQGLGFATLQANVMPIKVVRDTMWRRKRLWFGAAAGLAAAATAGWFVRPLMDMTAMNSVTEPIEIKKVISEGDRLKDEAEQAGVLGDSTKDTTASALIGLLANRGVYADLVNDLGQMLEDMRGSTLMRQGEGTKIRLAALETAFEPGDPNAEKAAKPKNQPSSSARDPRTSSGGGGGGLMVVQRQGFDPVQAMIGASSARSGPKADFPDEMKWNDQEINLAAKRRINVTLEFATNHADAEEVAYAVVAWLRDHQARDGVPYMIAVKELDEDVYQETPVQPPMPTGSPLSRSGRSFVSRPTPRGGGGGGLLVVGGGGGRPAMPGMTPSFTAGAADDDPQALIRQMNEVAAIGPEPAPDPATTDEPQEKGYQIAFTLLLDLPETKAAEGGDS